MSRLGSLSRLHLPVLVAGVALLAAGCSDSPTNPMSPAMSGTSTTSLSGSGAPQSAAGMSTTSQSGGGASQSSAGKVDVCHRSDSGFHLINISANALPAHLKHGDGQPLGTVPGGTNQVFGAKCEVLQLQLKQYTITLVSGASGSVGNPDPAVTWAKASGGRGTAVIINKHGVWALPVAGSQWVNWAILSNTLGTPHVRDDVTYSINFNLPAGAIDASLTGSFNADNRGDGYLNTSWVGGQPAGPAFTGGHFLSNRASVNASSGFVAGTNTLSFKVQDYGTVAGLTFSVTVTYSVWEL